MTTATGCNHGREAADKVARAVRGLAVVWPELAELPECGSDRNDAAQQVGTDRVSDRIEAAIQAAIAAARPPAKGKPPAKAPADRTSRDRTAGHAEAPPEPKRPQRAAGRGPTPTTLEALPTKGASIWLGVLRGPTMPRMHG